MLATRERALRRSNDYSAIGRYGLAGALALAGLVAPFAEAAARAFGLAADGVAVVGDATAAAVAAGATGGVAAATARFRFGFSAGAASASIWLVASDQWRS